jgi:hypothetical protein
VNLPCAASCEPGSERPARSAGRRARAGASVCEPFDAIPPVAPRGFGQFWATCHAWPIGRYRHRFGQLPVFGSVMRSPMWARLDLNQRPTGYEAARCEARRRRWPSYRGNILATSIASDVSHPSGKPYGSDDLAASAPIYTGRPRLMALWTVWSVEVRVLSGACQSPAKRGLLGFWTIARADCSWSEARAAQRCAVAGANRRSHRKATASLASSVRRQRCQ